MDQLNEEYAEEIVHGLQQGREGYLIGDNVDLTIKPNRERLEKQNGNKQCHWFNTDFVFDRVLTNDLRGTGSVSDFKSVTADTFMSLSTSEFESLVDAYCVIVGNIALEYIPSFAWLKGIVPKHLKHRNSSAMDTTSEVYMLPLLFKDEKKTADCIDILDETASWLQDWYRRAKPGIYYSSHRLNHLYDLHL